MQYLQYRLHVSASTLVIIRLAFNLSRYGVLWGTRSRFTIVGGMKVLTTIVKRDLVPHPPRAHHTDCIVS
jgi:hypothetical protein